MLCFQHDDLILQLSNPHAITEQEVSFSRGDRDVMRYLDEDIEVQIDEELIFTKGFKWKIKNKYFVDVENGYNKGNSGYSSQANFNY